MNLDLLVDNLEFDDFPQEISLERYESNKCEFIKYFQNHPAISSIYEIGGINDPGISDLDLILVFKQNCNLENNDYIFINQLDKQIFVHPPFVISDRIFPYVNYLIYASKIAKVIGKDFPLKNPESESAVKILLWIISVEAAISRISDIVFQITCGRNVSIRKMLLKLNSIRHNVNLFKSFIEKSKKRHIRQNWEEFTRNIAELRKSWFLYQKDDQIEKTRSHLCSGVAVLLEIIDQLALHSRRILNHSFEKKDNGFFFLPDSLQIFKFVSDTKTNIEIISNPFSFLKKLTKQHSSRISRHLNDISIIGFSKELMQIFLPRILGLSNFEKMLGEKAKQGTGKSILGKQPNHSDFLLRRFKIINEYNTYLKRQHFYQMSPLLMAPWNLDTKAKFHNIKKIILKSILKLQDI